MVRTLLHRVTNSPKSLFWAIVIDWIICSELYALIEGKGPIQGLWWGIVTGSTVGYGDFYPETTPGRFIGGVFIVSMYFLTIMLGALVVQKMLTDPDAWTDREQRTLMHQVSENNAMLRVLVTTSSGEQHLNELLEEHASSSHETA